MFDQCSDVSGIGLHPIHIFRMGYGSFVVRCFNQLPILAVVNSRYPMACNSKVTTALSSFTQDSALRQLTILLGSYSEILCVHLISGSGSDSHNQISR